MAYQNKVLVSDDPQVLSMYDFRTAKEYAAYLIPHLKPDFHILDIGSGPGGITRDLAQLVPQGKVIGLDISPGVVAQAKAKYQEPNLSFDVGDASDLSRFADNTFDVVHAHAVIMHLPDPVKTLKELRRVVKPGGVVATRDPPGPGLIAIQPNRLPYTRLVTEYSAKSMKFLDLSGSWSDAGLRKEAWAREAGFGEADGGRIWSQVSLEKHGRKWFLFGTGGTMYDKAIELGLFTREELEEWREIWDAWEREEDRELTKEMVDMLCWKGPVSEQNGGT